MHRAGCGRYGEQLLEDKRPGMHSVPKSAVLPYVSGVGGLSRRLLSKGANTEHGHHREKLAHVLGSTLHRVAARGIGAVQSITLKT